MSIDQNLVAGWEPKAMQFEQIGGRTYARFDTLSRMPGLRHAFSMRPLDVSARSDDQATLRDANRRQMARDLGLDAEQLCYCVQVHRTQIAIVDSPGPGRRVEDVDAIITSQPNVPVMTFSADCPLILAFDPVESVVGLVHASWRCTCAGATRRLIETMRSRFSCRPENIHAGIGPSAGPDQYEVKDDVYNSAAALENRDGLFRRVANRMYFDLWEANRSQLISSGVLAERIEIAAICTMSDSRFYSFRREGAGCGHFGLMAALSG